MGFLNGYRRLRLAAVASMALGVALLVWTARPHAQVTSTAAPSEFVAASQSQTGVRTQLALLSATTGRAQTVLATIGVSFTNNGLALSPDGRSVFFTLTPSPKSPGPLRLEQISVTTRKRTFVAYGSEPAISPSGRLLAYTTLGSGDTEGLAVRNLATRKTRSIDLTGLIGSGDGLELASTAWFAGGSDVAVMAGPAATWVAADGRPAAAATRKPLRLAATRKPLRLAATRKPLRLAATRKPLRLLVIHVGAGRLTARAYILPRPAGPVLGTDATDPHALVLATEASGDSTTVERITPAGTAVNVTRLVTIPAALPVALDPAGDQLLYLQGTGPSLMAATISSGHLTGPHQLIAESRLGAAAW
jgi:hypothetical protein